MDYDPNPLPQITFPSTSAAVYTMTIIYTIRINLGQAGGPE